MWRVAPRALHPTLAYGIGLRMRRRRTMLRAELRSLSWVEAQDGTKLEIMRRSAFTVSMGWRLGPSDALEDPPHPL